MVANFRVVGATFLDIRKKMAKSVTSSKRGTTSSETIVTATDIRHLCNVSKSVQK